MSLEELKQDLESPELKERFYREIVKRFGIRDMGVLHVIRYMIDSIVIGERPNDWCILKTLYTRTRVSTSLNQFYYHIIPRLVTIGFCEMRMFNSPTGESIRVVRLSERFVTEVLCQLMRALKNNRGNRLIGIFC